MLFLVLACGDPGFGGVDSGDSVDDDDAAAPVVNDHEFAPGTAPKVPDAAPTLTIKEEPKTTTKLEQELARANLDPARFPLIQLRVDVARLQLQLEELESKGLTAARDIEPKLEQATALLADAERIALHRMNVCLARRGIKSQVKNYRMTAAGPVPLSTREMIGEANALDVEGCVRIELVDQALVDRLKRAHELKYMLETVNFGYHRVAERRALEDELKGLEKQLANEDLPVLTARGLLDPYGR